MRLAPGFAALAAMVVALAISLAPSLAGAQATGPQWVPVVPRDDGVAQADPREGRHHRDRRAVREERLDLLLALAVAHDGCRSLRSGDAEVRRDHGRPARDLPVPLDSHDRTARCGEPD